MISNKPKHRGPSASSSQSDSTFVSDADVRLSAMLAAASKGDIDERVQKGTEDKPFSQLKAPSVTLPGPVLSQNNSPATFTRPTGIGKPGVAFPHRLGFPPQSMNMMPMPYHPMVPPATPMPFMPYMMPGAYPPVPMFDNRTRQVAPSQKQIPIEANVFTQLQQQQNMTPDTIKQMFEMWQKSQLPTKFTASKKEKQKQDVSNVEDEESEDTPIRTVTVSSVKKERSTVKFYHCHLCDKKVQGVHAYIQHVMGKKHQDQLIIKGLSNEKKKGQKSQVGQLRCVDDLRQMTCLALIGLQYCQEIHHPNRNIDDTGYRCSLCSYMSAGFNRFWPHVVSRTHRQLYMRKHYENVHKDYEDAVKKLSSKSLCTAPMIDDLMNDYAEQIAREESNKNFTISVLVDEALLETCLIKAGNISKWVSEKIKSRRTTTVTNTGQVLLGTTNIAAQKEAELAQKIKEAKRKHEEERYAEKTQRMYFPQINVGGGLTDASRQLCVKLKSFEIKTEDDLQEAMHDQNIIMQAITDFTTNDHKPNVYIESNADVDYLLDVCSELSAKVDKYQAKTEQPSSSSGHGSTSSRRDKDERRRRSRTRSRSRSRDRGDRDRRYYSRYDKDMRDGSRRRRSRTPPKKRSRSQSRTPRESSRTSRFGPPHEDSNKGEYGFPKPVEKQLQRPESPPKTLFSAYDLSLPGAANLQPEAEQQQPQQAPQQSAIPVDPPKRAEPSRPVVQPPQADQRRLGQTFVDDLPGESVRRGNLQYPAPRMTPLNDSPATGAAAIRTYDRYGREILEYRGPQYSVDRDARTTLYHSGEERADFPHRAAYTSTSPLVSERRDTYSQYARGPEQTLARHEYPRSDTQACGRYQREGFTFGAAPDNSREQGYEYSSPASRPFGAVTGRPSEPFALLARQLATSFAEENQLNVANERSLGYQQHSSDAAETTAFGRNQRLLEQQPLYQGLASPPERPEQKRPPLFPAVSSMLRGDVEAPTGAGTNPSNNIKFDQHDVAGYGGGRNVLQSSSMDPDTTKVAGAGYPWQSYR